ncbi:MAG: hypothetical protein A2W90_06980 [Bacteroidetes bacterium GWF2_42_66]|nr:MAG: hypothetical protein A2W92_01680 [Bacteroidetes bacterium GWA2_42_15]OFY02886.1 MAG: hypothetical protein A2W89_24385 [Bacteroidetes bacterium GWE2_42_39]OFY44541.1 MAG: hypothetical protein A2W90_06980 [Bacteroidetes bacterium GWF2_42_66]HBL74901.1 hypothetical protein [Prolixibacteraceae bacterium]HCU62350.1 hypothetical protein [Prolixibacteraceae bacterium]
MKAKNITILISGIILLAATITTSAQESTTMYFMKGMSQSTMYNPALHNDSSAVVIGLPGLSGMYFGLNSDFAVNDLIHYGTGNMSDSLVIDIDGFHNALKDQNTFRQNFDMSIFYLGFRTKNAFVSFSVNEKESAQIGFAKSFITFLKEGNAPYMGKTQDLGSFEFNSYHYREYALGYSQELMNGRLSVGAKFKALFGKFSLQTENLNFTVETAADGSSVKLQTDMQLNFSAPVTPEYNEDDYFKGFEDNFEPSEYVLGSDNMGMAFDLGAVFKVTPKVTVSASIIDIGKIPFKTNVYNVTKNESYTWEGLDFSNSMDDTDPNYISADDMMDEEMEKLKAVVKPKRSEISSNAFDMNLPTKVFIGGTYALNSKLNFGLLDRLYMYNGETANSITVSANAMLGNFFSVTGSYSAMNGTYDNLGLGLAMRLGFLQLYMASDNLMALSDPAKAQAVNVRFGLNILFGRKYQNFVH